MMCADDCGEPAVKAWDMGEDYAFWTREPRIVHLCAECWSVRDNYEPPDPDGEAFRGGEAAAYQAELMHQAQRLK
jgi:hypothetical protein